MSFLALWLMLMKPAEAGESGTESAHVDVALPVRLGHPQDRGVQPSPS